MPDAAGNFKGQGWSQRRSDAWERVFGREAKQTEATIAWLERKAESARENPNRDSEAPPA